MANTQLITEVEDAVAAWRAAKKSSPLCTFCSRYYCGPDDHEAMQLKPCCCPIYQRFGKCDTSRRNPWMCGYSFQHHHRRRAHILAAGEEWLKELRED